MVKKYTCVLLIFCLLLSLSAPAFAASGGAQAAAETLHSLGLFQGVGGGDFALDAPLTREEGVVLLLRLLGKEQAALAGGLSPHPFTDVSVWANPYFDFAYSQGLVQGASPTRFQAGDILQATEFLTLVLRALGYRDGLDFSWDQAWTLTDNLGITAGEYGKNAAFLRGDAALVCRSALSASLASGGKTLLAALLAAGAVTPQAIRAADLDSALQSGPMTARQMYSFAAPSILLVETFGDPAGNPYSKLGSGSAVLLAADGVAVTNYHVLEGSKYATALLTDGSRFQIQQILYANKRQDLCVFRLAPASTAGIRRNSFPYLEMAAHNTVYTGDEIYTIGCPLGLSSTISDGLVGCDRRIVADSPLPFIQITAPISKGSSGGALLNVYGQLIGITTATYTDSQNMNLAIPVDTILALDLQAPGMSYAAAGF